MGPPGDSRRAPYVESVVHLDETYSEPTPTPTPTEPPHHLAIVGSGGTAVLQAFKTSLDVPTRLASSTTAPDCLCLRSLAVCLLLVSVLGRGG